MYPVASRSNHLLLDNRTLKAKTITYKDIKVFSMGGKRLQFVISVPPGMRVGDINHIDHIKVEVIENYRCIDRLTLADAKKKYG